MGKIKTAKRNSVASISPYQKPDKPSKGGAKNNTIFKFNTNLGQHILKNGDVCTRIVDAAAIQPHDSVLEVGPGTGALTNLLLDKARDVTAVELDPRMAAELSRRVQGTPKQRKLKIILGDFIKLDMAEIPPHDVCVSNTPYQISSPLVFKLLSLPKQPRTAILMFQREFALRLIAKPGDAMYSRLSVNAQFFASISHVMKVGPKNFTPPPQVDSSVVRLEPRTNRPPISFDEFDGMLRVCFMRKNKTLRASWTGKQVRIMTAKNWLTFASTYPDKITDDDRAFLLGDGDDDEEEEGEEGKGEGEANDDDVDMDEGKGGEEANDDDDVDVDVDNHARGKGAQLPACKTLTLDGMKVARARVEALVRTKIDKVLQDTGLGPQRAAKCDETDFLRLLFAFNNEGLHFS